MEGGGFLLRQLIAVDGLEKVRRLISLYLSAHELAVFDELADIHGADAHEQSHVSLASVVGGNELFVQFGELSVLASHLTSASRQPLVLLISEYCHCEKHEREEADHRQYAPHDALLMRQRLLVGSGDDGEDARNLEHS